jgi:hypothetical protein
MSIYKLSFAKSRSVIYPARGTGSSETGDPPAGWGVQAKRGQIPRNERKSPLCSHKLQDISVKANKKSGPPPKTKGISPID